MRFVDGDPAELRVFLPGDDFAEDALDRVVGGLGVVGGMARSGIQRPRTIE